ncbi:iron ABC transporter permease [uncultured Meiothermus sp.]|jgi:iron(III) transport system permease protein|uniref:ABC transporter permease n=1 Tax=uncultured Meiothermus sp. TaxID=157471 RepID=UPI0026168E5F|nr:iron ABC transporter permease [uncultured Meiothermus sp.]
MLLTKIKQHGQGLRSLPMLPFLLVALVVLPVLVVGSALLTPTQEVWTHLWRTLLPVMMGNTLLLVLGVGTGTLILGVSLAWLVTAYRFPGRGLLEWLLVLPMAVPAYVQGYVYMATFDTAGPVQTALRPHFTDMGWFPEIRSGIGAILVMTLVLYPYVYLLARAAFRETSGALLEAARTMGHSPTMVFFRVVLPLARPSIVAGVALAIMEALADFATVRFFNFPTLSDGVIRVWHGMMDLRAASELAGLLALVALVVLLLEHAMRGRSRYFQTGGKAPRIAAVPLVGWRGWMALAGSLLVVAVAFVLPAGQLLAWTLQELPRQPPGTLAVYAELARNSIVLSALAAFFATLTALLIASGIRLSSSRVAFVLGRLATSGYAMTGAVIAVGIMVPLSAFDHALNNFLLQVRGVDVGLVLTGSVVGLVYAYVVRFIANSFSSIDASLEKITPNIIAAARVLGASPWRLLWQIKFPLILPGMLAGATLVFADVMKELPITMMLRPFGQDTLAIWVWQMAAESLWSGASLPALIIVLVGLLPVVFLVRLGNIKN